MASSRKPAKIPQRLCCLQTPTVPCRPCPAPCLKPCKRVRNICLLSFLHRPELTHACVSHVLQSELVSRPPSTLVCPHISVTLDFVLLIFSFSVLFLWLYICQHILQSRLVNIRFSLAFLIPRPCPLSRKCVGRSHQSATLSVCTLNFFLCSPHHIGHIDTQTPLSLKAQL